MAKTVFHICDLTATLTVYNGVVGKWNFSVVFIVESLKHILPLFGKSVLKVSRRLRSRTKFGAATSVAAKSLRDFGEAADRVTSNLNFTPYFY